MGLMRTSQIYLPLRLRSNRASLEERASYYLAIWPYLRDKWKKVGALKEAFEKARADNFYGTDESSLIEYLGKEVKVVAGSEFNIKITRSEDLVLGETIAALVKANGSGMQRESLS